MTAGVGQRYVIAAPFAVGIALAPLALMVAVAVAMNGRDAIGLLSTAVLLWGVIVPLAAAYPGLAAFVALRSRAETAVVGIAATAPAVVFAIRLLMEPIGAGCPGCQPDLGHGFVVRASLPAFVLIAVFTAIETALTAMDRPGRARVAVGFVLGAVILAIGSFLAVFGWTLIDAPHT